MAKFSGSTVQPGQNIVPDTPVTDLQERIPVAEETPTGSLDDLLVAELQAYNQVEPEQPGVFDQELPESTEGTTPGPIVPSVEEEIQRETIEPIGDRLRGAQAGTRINTYNLHDKVDANPTTDSNGGLFARARILTEKVQDGSLALSGWEKETHAGQETTLGPTFAAVQAISQETGKIDPEFITATSVITENFFATQAAGKEKPEGEGETVQEVDPAGEATIAQSHGDVVLGHQINSEWNRLKGRQPQQISKDQATRLGNAAKQLYARVAQEQGLIQILPSTEKGQEAAYLVTKEGANTYNKAKKVRAQMFPREHVRPTKTPVPRGELPGEKREVVKGVSGNIGKGSRNARVLQQAVANQNKIPHVVNKRRLRVLWATALPVLQADLQAITGGDPLLTTFADIHEVGQGKFNNFKAKAQLQAQEELKAQQEGRTIRPNDLDPVAMIGDLQHTLAQNLYGIAQERNGANYLTYDIQAFAGRMAPQQTHYDPTTSKTVRFVTGNATPVKVTPGSRQNRNIRQMYAMMLVPKKYGVANSEGKIQKVDALLPEGREAALEKATPELYAWGKRVEEVLNNSMTDAQAEAISQAIEKGIPLNSQEFPQVNTLALDPQADADLLAAIRDKGEDGPSFIEGLIDFKDYMDSQKAGRPHYSFFNAAIDGKTNGIASNGLMMGSEKVAMKTGATRSDNSAFALDDNIDIRDDLATILTGLIDNGFDGAHPDSGTAISHVAKKVFNNRDLNKKTTMTFGYGKDIDSFQSDIKDTIAQIAQTDPEFAEALNELEGEDVAGMLLSKYNDGLFEVMSAEGLEARSMMWYTSFMHAMYDEPITMESHTGYELRFGGNAPVGFDESVSARYEVVEDGKRVAKPTVTAYETKATAAASKRRVDAEGNVTEDVGGLAWGGAIPGPVQSLDAATVAKTFSGKSWDRLKSASHGNPFLHQVYDAFITDANGFDVVVKEANNNWLEAGLEWSYLEEAQKSLKKAQGAVAEKYKGVDRNTPLPISDFPYFDYLTTANDDGKLPFRKKLKTLTAWPRSMDAKEKNMNNAKHEAEIVNQLKKAGFHPGQETVTLNQLKLFTDLVNHYTKGPQRMKSLIDRTNHNKKELGRKIKSSGVPVLQYYAH